MPPYQRSDPFGRRGVHLPGYFFNFKKAGIDGGELLMITYVIEHKTLPPGWTAAEEQAVYERLIARGLANEYAPGEFEFDGLLKALQEAE